MKRFRSPAFVTWVFIFCLAVAGCSKSGPMATINVSHPSSGFSQPNPSTTVPSGDVPSTAGSAIPDATPPPVQTPSSPTPIPASPQPSPVSTSPNPPPPPPSGNPPGAGNPPAPGGSTVKSYTRWISKYYVLSPSLSEGPVGENGGDTWGFLVAPRGYAYTGFKTKTANRCGADVVAQFQPYAKPVDSSGVVDETHFKFQLADTPGDGGDATWTESQCPAGQALIGIGGRSGQCVDQLQAICGAVLPGTRALKENIETDLAK